MEVAQRTGVHAFHAGFPWLSPHHQVPNFQALPGNARLVKKSNRPSSSGNHVNRSAKRSAMKIMHYVIKSGTTLLLGFQKKKRKEKNS